MIKLTRFLTIPAVILLLFSCGSKQDPTVAVTSVALSSSSLSLVEGESQTLTATVNPADATEKTVTWATSDAQVASVSGGKVTAVKEGSATITASCGGKSATCAVTVQKKVIPVSTITLNKTEFTLKQNETFQLTATVGPDDATDKTVTWTSGDAAVVTVTNGLVKALKEGTATVTAKAGDKTATCTVKVSNATTGGNEGTTDENWD